MLNVLKISILYPINTNNLFKVSTSLRTYTCGAPRRRPYTTRNVHTTVNNRLYVNKLYYESFVFIFNSTFVIKAIQLTNCRPKNVSSEFKKNCLRDYRTNIGFLIV